MNAFALLFLFVPALASEQKICDYYTQKSQALGCADSDYLVSFGEKYCRTFVEVEKEFSPAGQEVFAKIRHCLVDTLKATPDLSCANTREKAERSHVDCYHRSGYCQLGAHDNWVVLKRIWQEFFDPGFLRVVRDIQKKCGE